MTLIQKEPQSIKIGNPSPYGAMQGPCATGFHIPTKQQWVEIYNAWTTLGGGSKDATNFGIALKLPFAGYRDYDMTIRVVGTSGHYWTCEAKSNTTSYALSFSSIGSGDISTGSSFYRATARSIRAFKDMSVEPTTSWTKMYGTSIESGGIFWDSVNGLISISGDGSNWITIADKNLGATTVWNGGDTLTDANCGYFYQWGNNYGFAHSGAVSYSYNKVDASSYGPGNYYSDSIFRYINSSPNNWDSSNNLNLRGGETGVQYGIEVQKVYIGSTQVRPTSRLPSAYQEVEYIQSSGTQYIKIGTSFKTSYKTVIDFQMNVIGGDYIPIGINNYGGADPIYRYGIDAYSSYFHVNAGGNWTSTKAEDTNRHTIIIDKNTAIVDGTSYTIGYSNYTYSSGICVFSYNEYNTSSPYKYMSSNKLYKLDIYDENGIHIYDLVPCYRKLDNVIGLYDLVNNQFYTNSGSGTFSKGSDV